MKFQLFKHLPIIFGTILLLIAFLAHNDIMKNGGYTQAELGAFLSIIPFVASALLLSLYYISNQVYNSIKFQIFATIISIIVFAPIFISFLSIVFS